MSCLLTSKPCDHIDANVGKYLIQNSLDLTIPLSLPKNLVAWEGNIQPYI